MRLVYKSHPDSSRVGTELRKGDRTVDFRGNRVEVDSWIEPHNPASTGRVAIYNVTRDGGLESGPCLFYPDVIGAEWIEREDWA